MPCKRILICGGRNFDNWEIFSRAMYTIEIHEDFATVATILSGAARGADRMAVDWAICAGHEFEMFPADWETLGKKAGYVRNKAMLETNPDLVVAFPGGVGTNMMTMMARAKGTRVLEVWLSDKHEHGYSYSEKTDSGMDLGAEEYEAIMAAEDALR